MSKLLIPILLAACIFTSGCAACLIGSMAAEGAVLGIGAVDLVTETHTALTKSDVRGKVNCDPAKAWEAAKQFAEGRKFTNLKINEKKDKKGGIIKAQTEVHGDVKITVCDGPEGTTEIGVRARRRGWSSEDDIDMEYAQELFDGVKRKLTSLKNKKVPAAKKTDVIPTSGIRQ